MIIVSIHLLTSVQWIRRVSLAGQTNGGCEKVLLKMLRHVQRNGTHYDKVPNVGLKIWVQTRKQSFTKEKELVNGVIWIRIHKIH